MLPVKKEKDRSRVSGIKLQVWGLPKIGKTSLAKSLDPKKTLFIDAEKGMLSLKGWDGDSIDVEDWPTVKNLVCHMTGPSRQSEPGKAYSMAHFKAMVKRYGPYSQYKKYDTVFIDSTTLIGRYAFSWAKRQPEAFNKKGEPNLLGAYGLLGNELMDMAWRLQATPRMNVVLVGGIKEKDDGGWEPLIDGSAAHKLLYVFDEIITMAFIHKEDDDSKKFRALVCKPSNPGGYPAGDRSGKLKMYEQPDLDKLLNKIKV